MTTPVGTRSLREAIVATYIASCSPREKENENRKEGSSGPDSTRTETGTKLNVNGTRTHLLCGEKI